MFVRVIEFLCIIIGIAMTLFLLFVPNVTIPIGFEPWQVFSPTHWFLAAIGVHVVWG